MLSRNYTIFNVTLHRRTPVYRTAQIRRLFHLAEVGSMDGGSFADIVYMPFLLAVLLFGLMVALVGFWRVGASYATLRSVQIGAVAPSQGNTILSSAWSGWTGGNGLDSGFSIDTTNRTVKSNITTDKAFNLGELGAWQFTISAGAGTHARSERFYPGQP
jgi:hypothetical protein